MSFKVTRYMMRLRPGTFFSRYTAFSIKRRLTDSNIYLFTFKNCFYRGRHEQAEYGDSKCVFQGQATGTERCKYRVHIYSKSCKLHCKFWLKYKLLVYRRLYPPYKLFKKIPLKIIMLIQGIFKLVTAMWILVFIPL